MSPRFFCWSFRPLIFVVSFVILVSQSQQTDGAAIPIWELLKHEEKVKNSPPSHDSIKYILFCAFCHEILLTRMTLQFQILNLNFSNKQMGRLFYVFVHLVEQYCKTSDIPGNYYSLLCYSFKNFSPLSYS